MGYINLTYLIFLYFFYVSFIPLIGKIPDDLKIINPSNKIGKGQVVD